MTAHARPGSLAETAYEDIRRLIIRAEFPPGHRFTELGLAEMHGVGKTPIREALARLVRDGLVESIPRVGYRVTPITLREMFQLFEFRLIVEPACARLAAGRVTSAQEVGLMELATAPTPEKDDPGFLDAITHVNHEFHLTIARISGNARLVRSEEEVLLEGERLYRLVIADMQPSEDHRRIAEALIAGQADRAGDLARDHIVEVRDRIMETYLSSQAVLESEIILPQRYPRLIDHSAAESATSPM